MEINLRRQSTVRSIALAQTGMPPSRQGPNDLPMSAASFAARMKWTSRSMQEWTRDGYRGALISKPSSGAEMIQKILSGEKLAGEQSSQIDGLILSAPIWLSIFNCFTAVLSHYKKSYQFPQSLAIVFSTSLSLYPNLHRIRLMRIYSINSFQPTFNVDTKFCTGSAWH